MFHRRGFLMTAALGGPLAALTGCVNFPSEPTGPTERTRLNVEAGRAESVAAEIHMAVGELVVEGGAEKLLEGEAVYNVPSFAPVVTYDDQARLGRLKIEQKRVRTTLGNRRNNWNLRFNDKLPLSLTLHLGAGESRLALGRTNLRGVTVHMGAGRIELDLRGGELRHDFPVTIHGGVGDCTVRVPKTLGVTANIKGGIGRVDAYGLRQENGRYFSEAPRTATTALATLEIHAGIGHLRIYAE